MREVDELEVTVPLRDADDVVDWLQDVVRDGAGVIVRLWLTVSDAVYDSEEEKVALLLLESDNVNVTVGDDDTVNDKDTVVDVELVKVKLRVG